MLLSKAEGISRSVYVSLSFDMPRTIIKEIGKLLYNFVWRNKTHYLSKAVIRNAIEQGGLAVLDMNRPTLG